MKNFTKILLFFVLLGLSVSGFSGNGVRSSAIADNDRQTVELVINGDKYPIQNVNPNGRVDIYSIIGAKVVSFDIKSGVVTDSSISLPKGYYIIKIDDKTRKIAVK
ncbi:MAG: T9SS type A sorting domain-containing protein [Dysgonomonas sp.]